MHIAFLNPQGNFDPENFGLTEHPDFGGQLVYVKELAQSMSEKENRVDIITRKIVDKKWPPFQGDLDHYPGFPNLRILRFVCGPAHFIRKEELWPHINEWTENICQFYKKEQNFPDIVTGHYGDGGLAAAIMREQISIPFTFTGHSLGAQKMDKVIDNVETFTEKVEYFQFDKRIVAERIAIEQASRIITSTIQERDIQYGHRLYRTVIDTADQEKFAVIPPGVNLKIFGCDRQNKHEKEIAEKVEGMINRDIPKERRHLPLVICSSRLDRKKNHLAIIKAWSRDRELREVANLAIIARGTSNALEEWQNVYDGEEYLVFSDIARLISDNALHNCVTSFDLNGQEELAAAYRYLAKNKQGIFVLTAVYEPFGLAPLEAMAAGLPAVVTRNGGPSESLVDENGKYGVLIDPENIGDVAQGIKSLAGNIQYWEQMQKAGLTRIKEKYTWDRTADSYLMEFNRILLSKLHRDKKSRIPQYFYNDSAGDIKHQWLKDLYYEK